MAAKNKNKSEEEKLILHGNQTSRGIIVEQTGLEISCRDFKNDEFIPAKYTCDGENTNPPIHIKSILNNSKSLAAIMEDLDAPGGIFTHWLVWNIPPAIKIEHHNALGMNGMNDFGVNQYSGPCPPAGRTHRYIFHVYALNTILELKPDSSRKDLEKAMQSHIIGNGEIRGLYKKKE